jgi:hypothetical protein
LWLLEDISLTATETPHSKYPHVHAIVRIDLPVSEDNPENSVSVVKVHASKVEAEKEVTRLRDLNRDKGCLYHVYTTRMIS